MPVNGLWSYVLKDRRLTLCDKVDLIQVAKFYKEKFGMNFEMRFLVSVLLHIL